MCGLARTTGGVDSTFVLMGGDICHFAGDYRPSPQLPLPDPIPSGTLDEDPASFPSPCPCSLFTDHHPLSATFQEQGDMSRTTPFYKVSTHSTSAYIDPLTSQRCVDKLVHLDGSSSVMVCIAHDTALLQHLPTLNDHPTSDLNQWKVNGWKEKCHWGWLNELARNGKPGRKPVVTGFWRDNKPWDNAKDELEKAGQKASGSGL